MHISSLPSPCGIGSLGKAAREFADFLSKAGQSCWQTLPICPTSYGDSPYQSCSTYAGNPYFIDLDLLREEGLLDEEDYCFINWGNDPGTVDYGKLYEKRFDVLELAVKRFLERIGHQDPQDPDRDCVCPDLKEYQSFCRRNAFWLDDYALFMTMKEVHGGRSFMDWEPDLKNRKPEAIKRVKEEHASRIVYWKTIQFFFFRQWHSLHEYCRNKGISIIGDLPFYVSLDSVDVWAHPELFLLDKDNVPIEVAGVPPDGFSETGQLWGNPVYRWDEHRRTGYAWWISKIDYLCHEYDILRIDHFRGFDSYYTVPWGSEDARGGKWNPGPGTELFDALKQAVGERAIIAEDLGYTTESVKKLLADTGFPGMKILQFGFDERDESSPAHRPHVYPVNCVAYTGTHDNDTLRGFLENASRENVALAKDYLRLQDPDRYHWDMIKALFSTAAQTVIVPVQDLLGLGSDCRMNTPSTLGGNWCFRVRDGALDDALAARLRHITELYGRSGSGRSVGLAAGRSS